jgi:hypothetical protein
MEIYIFLGLISFSAGFVQGLSGFGSVLLSLPLLALFLDIKTAIPLVALFGVVLSIFLLVQLRRFLNWKILYPLLAGSVPGIPIGVWLLKRTDVQWIQWAVGAVLVAYALYGIAWRPAPRNTKALWAYLSGFAAGCLGGAIGAAGPPVIVYTSIQSWSKDQIKVTLQGFFVASGVLVVFSQAVGGLVTGTILWYFLASLPLLIAGTWIGSLFYGRLREETYRRVILILLAALGVFMILK